MALVTFAFAHQPAGDPTVRIGLFAAHPPEQLQLTAYGGLRLAGRHASGAITLTRRGAQVFAKDEKGAKWLADSIMMASRGGRWIDIQPYASQKPFGPARRTVGMIKIDVHGGHLEIINIVPVETYVLGVVNGELGSVHLRAESLKAQIVASRSYILASRGRHKDEGFDFCDGPHCEVYSGTAEINREFKIAMLETRGQYLSYKGQPIPAFFHDTCGGRTAAVQDVWNVGAVPYLVSVDDPYCKGTARAHWCFRIAGPELCQCLRRAGWIGEEDALDDLHVAATDRSGRAVQIGVQSNRSLWVPAGEFRVAVNSYFKQRSLPSTLFLISREGRDFVFTGRGWGHGVGLCQTGAIEMANKGKSYREILQHYYPGTQLDHLAEPDRLFHRFLKLALKS